MTIRRKLLMAFSVYMILALIPAAFSYRELHTIRKRLKPAEVASEIMTTYLELRKNEKTYLLLKDQDTLQLFRTKLSMLKGNIDDIQAEILREIGEKNHAVLRDALSSYEAIVERLAENFSGQQSAINDMTVLGRKIEKLLADKELQKFLVLRRLEKNLVIQRDSSSLDVFNQTLASLHASSSPDLARYASVVKRLFELYQEERSLDAQIRRAAAVIQTYTDNILQAEREDIDSLLRMSMSLLLFSLGAIIFVGALINMRLAASIAAPIRQIRKFAELVAGGDFSQTLHVGGSQEFVLLSEALNQMTVRLKDTVSSLELAIQNLHDKQGHLVEAEKLASLGRIAAGVAHEINNPLAIINEKAGLMRDILQISQDFEQKENLLTQIQGITGSINRCRTITHRLLGFSRRMDITIEQLNLNEAIRESIAFLRSDIFTKNARLDLNLADDLPDIRSDKIQLEQVFLNLIKNAVDAICEGGEITVTTSRKDADSIQVFISDNGPGIPRDKVKHIFEPFFTTKERGKGTGLGLFVSHAILRKLGCRIKVQSEAGKGTTFVLDIPINASVSRRVSE